MTNKKTDHIYMQVDKAYFGSGLKPIEILIMSQVDEFIRNGQECYVTDEQLADCFGVTRKTISNTMNNLEEKGYIKRNTQLRKDNGQKSRIRTLEHGESWAKNVMPNRYMTE